MADKKFVTFDFGATSGRAIVGNYDGDKLDIKEYHRFENNPVVVDGHLYWDILRLFHELKQGLINIARDGITDVESIGVDTWGVDFVLLDKYGFLMGNPFHYRDRLTEGIMPKVFDKIPSKELYNRTGIQFMWYNTIFQLAAISEKFPSITRRARDFLFLPDYFNYLLSGKKAAEFSIVSTSQLYNLESKNWDYEIIEKLGLKKSLLQKIINPGTVLGELKPEISDETGVRGKCIAVCGHDTGSAVLAVPKKKGENCAFLSCGTWSLLGVELDEPVVSEAGFEAQYANEGGYDRSVRFLKNIMGLWIYTEVKREFEKKFGKVDYATLDKEVLAAEPFKAFIDPDDDRFATPGNMTAKITEYCELTGQTPPKTRGEFLRCALESLALKYRYAIEHCEKIIGKEIPVLRAVGGGCKDKQLMQFSANAIGRPVYAGPVEATAIGNICAQMLALGLVKDVWEARELVARSFPIEEYYPEDRDKWEEAYDRYKKLFA